MLKIIKNGSQGREHIHEKVNEKGFVCSLRLIDKDIAFLRDLGFHIKTSYNTKIKHTLQNPEKDYFKTIKSIVL